MTLPLAYEDLADWWPLFSPPHEYAADAKTYREVLIQACDREPKTLLELGSGGGNNAMWLRQHFEMTLVDLAPRMLEVSLRLNPDCEHQVGDMRTIRLGREFDAVFVHDAVDYMTTEADLRAAVETAFVHCRVGGAALFAPDYVRETFAPSTTRGGADEGERSLRYIAQTTDPDPSDTSYSVDFEFSLIEDEGEERVVSDHHDLGLFARAEWLQILRDVGFEPMHQTFEPASPEFDTCELFVGVRR